MPACLAALGDAPVALVTLNLEEFRRVSGLQFAELAPDDTEI